MSRNTLVYSTETGADCPHCGNSLRKCSCQPAAIPTGKPDPVRITRSSKGRRGKPVMIITGLPVAELGSLCKWLKSACATGGSVQGSEILIQGDHREKVRDLLAEKGHHAKLAGG